jgi:hypothetical protein
MPENSQPPHIISEEIDKQTAPDRPVAAAATGSAPEIAAMAEKVHRFFTASPHFPDDMPAAWEDGKDRLKRALRREITITEELTLADYCRATGATIDPV